MSQENVEVVRRAIEALNAHDTDRLLSLLDAEIEFRSAVERRVYRGPAELARFWEEVLGSAIGQARIETDRFLDAGKDRILHLYRVVGRGAASGVPVSRDVAALWQLRNGKLVRGEVYLDQRQALEAAGLRE